MSQEPTGPTVTHTTLDYHPGESGVPSDAGDGIAFTSVSTEGFLHCTMFWTEPGGQRHTIILTAKDTRLFEVFARYLLDVSRHFNAGENGQLLIELRRAHRTNGTTH